MFSSGFLRSISLATVTPSFVMVGEPNFLSITTLRPFGPSVDVRPLACAVVLDLAGACGNHPALLRLFLGRVGDDDPADLLFAFLEALDDEAVVERSDIHRFRLQLTNVTAWIGPDVSGNESCE